MSKGKILHHPGEVKGEPESGAPPVIWELYAPDPRPHYRILVNDLVLTCMIGVHDYEHERSQRVRFSVELTAEDNLSSAHDNINNVISYEDVVKGIKALTGRGHVELVETLAEEIAALCLADQRVLTAMVRVEKLDVYAEAGSVGVEILREQKKPGHAEARQVLTFGPVVPPKK